MLVTPNGVYERSSINRVRVEERRRQPSTGEVQRDRLLKDKLYKFLRITHFMAEEESLSLTERLDLIFVPSSIYRFHKKGKLDLNLVEPVEADTGSRFNQICQKINPYLNMVILEEIRLLGYLCLAEQILEYYSS